MGTHSFRCFPYTSRIVKQWVLSRTPGVIQYFFISGLPRAYKDNKYIKNDGISTYVLNLLPRTACKLIYLFCMAIHSCYVQISKTYISYKVGLSMKSTTIQITKSCDIDSFTVNCCRELVWLAAITCLISLHRGPLELYSAYPLKNT